MFFNILIDKSSVKLSFVNLFCFLFLGEYLIREWRPDLIEKVLAELHPNNLRKLQLHFLICHCKKLGY
jgi:hypothetical protein